MDSKEQTKQKNHDLTAFEKHVIENKGTEPPFTGLYTETMAEGVYHCKKCLSPLYTSEHKFLSHCGWPSFDDEIPGAVRRLPDKDGLRTEILCNACQGHLGHVFKGEYLTEKNLRHCVNSVSLEFKPKIEKAFSQVVLASGCFWGTQHFLSRVKGVVSTLVGYSGGHVESPTYKQVCTGTTGHVEAVQVTYDPTKVSLRDLVKMYFETHDFSQKNGQGPDIGPQYLSVMFYGSQEERLVMEGLIEQLKAMGHTVSTSLKPAVKFWVAEDYHQNYYERKGDTPYCHIYRKIFV